jgi:hypothetical protein
MLKHQRQQELCLQVWGKASGDMTPVNKGRSCTAGCTELSATQVTWEVLIPKTAEGAALEMIYRCKMVMVGPVSHD